MVTIHLRRGRSASRSSATFEKASPIDAARTSKLAALVILGALSGCAGGPDLPASASVGPEPTLPAPNPFININTQPWSQANVFDNLSGSLGIQQAINSQWRWQAQIGTQRLKSQDRLAYPYGCFDAGTGAYYADRYCPNGDFDLYDFRSTNERRRTHAAQIRAIGQLDTGAVRHHLSFGVLASRFIDRGEPQADNNSAVGTGNLFTLPIGLASFQEEYTFRWDLIMAGASIITLPLLFFFLLMQKFIVQGLLGGAVKG